MAKLLRCCPVGELPKLRYRFARQAETLGKSVYDHAPGAIMLSAGSAYPMSLPDVSHEAAEAARHKEETMQYGPLMGLDDFRDCIAAYVAEDGVTCSRENILATNGDKHATELALRVFTDRATGLSCRHRRI